MSSMVAQWPCKEHSVFKPQIGEEHDLGGSTLQISTSYVRRAVILCRQNSICLADLDRYGSIYTFRGRALGRPFSTIVS